MESNPAKEAGPSKFARTRTRKGSLSVSNSSNTSEPGTETVACPLCENSQLGDWFSRVDSYSDRKRRWTVQQCSRCGLGLVNPRPTCEAMGQYYPYTYSWHDDAEVEAADVDAQKSLERTYRYHLLRKEARDLRKLTGLDRGRVLDVGCAAGDRLVVCRELGYEVCGVEVSPAADFARSLGFDVHHGDLESAPFESGTFDIITLYHTF